MTDGILILCMRTVYGVKKKKKRKKTFHRNAPLSEMDSKPYPWCVSVGAGWWSTASCQRHRDTTLIGTHGASAHHRQALFGPLKSCHIRTAVHCSPFTNLLRFQAQVEKSGSDPALRHRAAPFPLPDIPLTRRTWTKMLVTLSPFAHTSLMMRQEMLSEPGPLFSHSWGVCKD